MDVGAAAYHGDDLAAIFFGFHYDVDGLVNPGFGDFRKALVHGIDGGVIYGHGVLSPFVRITVKDLSLKSYFRQKAF